MPSDSEHDDKLADFATLNMDGLERELDTLNIGYSKTVAKAELQARCALHRLGYLDANADPDPPVLATITAWCRKSAGEFDEEFVTRGLAAKSTKWKRVQALIEYDFDPMRESGSELDPAADTAMANSGLAGSKQPDHTVVNLLITMIFAGLGYVNDTQMPKCPIPVKPAATIREHLKLIQHFKSAGELTSALEAPVQPRHDIVRWICRTFGHDIVPATGSLKIPGVPASVRQFIVAKQVPELQESFDAQMKTNNFESSLAFHGTGMRSLFPILRQGFNQPVWLAKAPCLSYEYAANKFHADPLSQWTGSPFRNYGVLLACEVARSLANFPGGAAVFAEESTIGVVIVRYILLIEEIPLGGVDLAPTRASIEQDMVAAFKKIQAGDFGSGS